MFRLVGSGCPTKSSPAPWSHTSPAEALSEAARTAASLIFGTGPLARQPAGRAPLTACPANLQAPAITRPAGRAGAGGSPPAVLRALQQPVGRRASGGNEAIYLISVCCYTAHRRMGWRQGGRRSSCKQGAAAAPPPARHRRRAQMSAMVTSTSTPGSMEMEVICFTTSAGGKARGWGRGGEECRARPAAGTAGRRPQRLSPAAAWRSIRRLWMRSSNPA